MGRLEGLRALVTGAGQGIGSSTAVLFAREGAEVAVVDRDANGAERTSAIIEQAGGVALRLVADVRDASAVADMLQTVEQRFDRLDILVNNAAVMGKASFPKMRADQWNAVWETNLMGAIHCTQAAIPLLKKARTAAVVNIASITLSHHARRLTAYAASKGALASLSRSLALELAPLGIRVNYVCPGFIRTEMTRRWWSKWMFRKYVEFRTPLGRMGEPEDVAKVVLFLASSDANFVTGSGITVDGGLTLQAV